MRTPFRASPPPIRPNDGRRDFQPPQSGRQTATRHSSLTSPPSYRPSATSEETQMSRDSLSYGSDVGTPTRDPRPEESVEAAPAAEKPARRPAGEHTLIDRHTTIQGTLRSAKDLRVEGRVEGEIVCDGKITIAEGAVVQARVEAAEVIISGSVEGDVHSHGQFKLQPSAVIRGSTMAARITIEDGATYEGELHMTSDTPRPEDVPETPLAGVMAGRSSERARTGSNGNGAGA